MLAPIAFVSCSSYKSQALIDDITSSNVGKLPDYRVVAVDGAVEKRASSNFVTMVPDVVVSPGTHMLTVKKRRLDGSADDSSQSISAKVEVEAGHQYWLRVVDGRITLTEEKR
ncbi:MAG TPA: hypothetical protein VK717_10050 [Opitutaceae bacterium]|nr:hypothetical protein [Opitutaceae bacterium]